MSSQKEEGFSDYTSSLSRVYERTEQQRLDGITAFEVLSLERVDEIELPDGTLAKVADGAVGSRNRLAKKDAPAYERFS